MSDQSSPIVHVAGWAWTLGGLQSNLQLYRDRDEAQGRRALYIGILDRQGPDHAGVFLRARWWHPVGLIRRRFQHAMRGWEGATVVYHDGWGLPWWVDLDGANRRIVVLHTEYPHLDELLRRYAPLVDGFMGVSQHLANRAAGFMPSGEVSRSANLPYFVTPPPDIQRLAKRTEGPWKIGYAGRLAGAHKRIERLPDLVVELDKLGMNFELEILGEGELEGGLREAFGRDPRVRFLGRRSGDAYWQTVAGWDCMVLVSDYEGFSRVTMESMHLGVLPVHPDFSPAAAEILGPLAAESLYPTGDMQACAQALKAYHDLPLADQKLRRKQATAHMASQTIERHEQNFTQFIEKTQRTPRQSRSPRLPWWESILPLGLHTRLFPRRFS